ncbi:hypothetical protein JKF63_07533 [Porcisia hertigi]|uniref:Uncharacterized protein n=1 Tax=Porcisia hertigi TaxID=2761500 RepID=A0A836LIZ8_9TRYP|nr:hypothetical protein JKF63_07533 [Porcisia hertigi]
MLSANRLARSELTEAALLSPIPHAEDHSQRHSASSQRASYSRYPSCTVLDNSPTSGVQSTSSLRYGALNDLPLSVNHFLFLCSKAGTAATKRDLRRQLLVLRDHCVEFGNKMRGKELLSQGGKHISRRVEATVDFNSGLNVILASSLVFAEEAEDIDRDILCSIVEKLKSAQNSGDEKIFRATVVEVVNRILLCTPLAPPVCDLASLRTMETCEVTRQQSGEREPTLKDECLDFLVLEEGIPVLLECRWMRWLRFFEEGYVQYVERLLNEQQQAAKASAVADAAVDSDHEEAKEAGRKGHVTLAAGAPPIAAMPLFTPRKAYWKSKTSAYAQFCHLLLAIYFVRTKDFSLNYLARITKLVQYYEHQLEFEDGKPIVVREGAEDELSDYELRDKEGEGLYADVEQHIGLHTAAAPLVSTPGHDSCVTSNTFMSCPSSVMPESATEKPRRRWHKCFITEELPEEVRPAAELSREESLGGVAAGKSQAVSSALHVRYADRIDLPNFSVGRQRERE